MRWDTVFVWNEWIDGYSFFLGTSPADSGTIESVFFDEPVPHKIIVQELTTPETVKLDLLIQTKTLSEKVNSKFWKLYCRFIIFNRWNHSLH
jgi:hypothetical protein